MEVDIERTANYSANIVSVPSGLGSDHQQSTSWASWPTRLPPAARILGFVGGKHDDHHGPQRPADHDLEPPGPDQGDPGLHQDQRAVHSADHRARQYRGQLRLGREDPGAAADGRAGRRHDAVVTKENVELSIKIKPQINKISNFVKLETEVKIGDIPIRRGQRGRDTRCSRPPTAWPRRRSSWATAIRWSSAA